jgi:glycine cleavage system H protein
VVSSGEEVAVIETIKVILSLASPVSGTIVEANPAMETAPEGINFDSYGTGWLAVIEAKDWVSERLRLLDPQAYFEHIKAEAEREVKRE